MAVKLMAAATCTGVPSQQTAFARPCRHRHHERFSSSSYSPCSVASCSSSSSSSSFSATTRLLRTTPTVFVAPAASGQTARVTCFFGGEKRDAARRALESALGEKKEAYSKWDEEIKKREATGGGGPPKGRGRGWGGGGGGGDKGGGDDLPEGSEGGFQFGEALQVVYAFAGLASLYLVLTQGGRMLALVLNALLFVSRGFKPRPKPRYAPYAPADNQLPGHAESHVRSKWGSDD